jgi:hypothetical protein
LLAIQESASAGNAYQPSDHVLEQMRTLAPGWDRQGLVVRYNEWRQGKEPPVKPDAAFIGWVKNFMKGKAPS